MDSLITAAARALAAGDPLGAMKRVALRDDAPALALRGIAMAQLGDFDRARALLRRAQRAFDAGESVARARCAVAEAEVALASRDLVRSPARLAAARAVLESHGDTVNAAYAGYLEARHDFLVGKLDQAERKLRVSNDTPLPPSIQTVRELITAAIAIRRVRTRPARDALARAEHSARLAGIPALEREVHDAWQALNAPAARLIGPGGARLVGLEEVEALYDSGLLIVDACCLVVRLAGQRVSLAGRPVLFALAQALGEAWPADVPRSVLGGRVFRLPEADESLRARLRVDVGRLRRTLRGLAKVRATTRGFRLDTPHGVRVGVLARPFDEPHGDVLALLADNEPWSSGGLALALATSQRTVQRALGVLSEQGKVQCYGRGRARRWVSSPVPGFTTTLLLPALLPDG